MAKFAVGGGSSLVFTLWGVDYHYNSEGLTGPSQYIKDALFYGFREPNMGVRAKLRELTIFYGYDLKEFLNESPDGRLASVDREKVEQAYNENHERMLEKGKASWDTLKVVKESAFEEEIAKLREEVRQLKELSGVGTSVPKGTQFSEKARSALRDLELENEIKRNEAAAEKPAVDEKGGLPYMD